MKELENLGMQLGKKSVSKEQKDSLKDLYTFQRVLQRCLLIYYDLNILKVKP